MEKTKIADNGDKCLDKGKLAADNSGMPPRNGDRTVEEVRELCIPMYNRRAKPGEAPRGDIRTIQPEFIEYSDEGVLTVKVPLQEWQVNDFNTIQGGLLAYMIDTVVGPLGFIVSGCDSIGTVDLSTTYLRPVTLDDEYVIIKAQVKASGKRIMHAKAELYTPNGKLAVSAVTNILKSKPRGQGTDIWEDIKRQLEEQQLWQK